MNFFHKIYCRIFQSVLKVTIPFLPYHKPHMIDTIDDLPKVLYKEGKKHPMIVTDEQIVSLSLVQPIIEVLDQKEIRYTIYDKTSVNPTLENIEEAYRLYFNQKCDSILAIGGGSCLDCAKGLGIRVVRKRTPLRKMKGILKVWRKLPLLIAVPTTAGTGSECTLAAVITDPSEHDKFAIEDFPLIPSYALLDPKMTRSLPPFLTATTGMDALTHAIEAYIGRATTKDTREAALKAIALIFENIFTAVHHGENLKARKNMAQAAYLAGWAFSKSYVGYVHALAHSLGGFYGTQHGYANAILLPVVLRGYGNVIYDSLKDCAIAAGLAQQETDKRLASLRLIDAIEQMNQEFHIGNTISDIKLLDIPLLCEHAAKEANPLYPVPVLWNEIELERFYIEVMNEKENLWKPVIFKRSLPVKETIFEKERV